MSEDFNLPKSEEKIGQLYPVIKDKKGRIIDGYHRKNAKSTWREETLEFIDSDEKYLKARIISNLHRRTVGADEIRGWINELAEEAKKNYNLKPGEFARWIAEETGYDEKTVLRYLDSKYKDPLRSTQDHSGRLTRPVDSPLLVEAEEKLGLEGYKKLRDEVKKQLLQDPLHLREAAHILNKNIVENATKQTFEEQDKSEYINKSRKYRDLIEDTFYKIRGWGLPMILSMGTSEWSQAKQYIEGIHNWTGWLLGLTPTTKQAKLPEENIIVNPTLIIEAEYQIKEATE